MMQIMIRDIVAKWPGATHATHIWNNRKLAKAFEDCTIKGAWLLGDSGYALKPWLLTPTTKGTQNNRAQRIKMYMNKTTQKLKPLQYEPPQKIGPR